MGGLSGQIAQRCVGRLASGAEGLIGTAVSCRAFLAELRQAHDLLTDVLSSGGVPTPRNQGAPDKARRLLDCAVIECLHTLRVEDKLDKYDTNGSVFSEGGNLYPWTTFTVRVRACGPLSPSPEDCARRPCTVDPHARPRRP